MLRALGTDCPSARWLQHHRALDVLETKGMRCAPPVNVSERSTAGPRPGCSGVRWDSFDTAGSAAPTMQGPWMGSWGNSRKWKMLPKSTAQVGQVPG